MSNGRTERSAAAAASTLLEALKSHAPSVLEELRECLLPLASPMEAATNQPAVAEWATRHNLHGAPVIAQAADLLLFWSMNPHAAAALRVGGTIVVIVGPDRPESPAEKEWVAAHSRLESAWCDLPNPSVHSLSQWLARAEEMYREREQIIYNGGARPRSRPKVRDEMPRHCSWFVKVHIHGVRPLDLAKAMKVDRAAIERATHKVARLLGVQRRTWPHGPR